MGLLRVFTLHRVVMERCQATQLILATRMSLVNSSTLRYHGRMNRDIKPQDSLEVFVEIPLIQQLGQHGPFFKGTRKPLTLRSWHSSGGRCSVSLFDTPGQLSHPHP